MARTHTSAKTAKQSGLLRKLLRLLFWLWLLHLGYVVALRWVNPPLTLTQLVSRINGDGLTQQWVSSNAIAPAMRLAVIAAEDQLFATHYGFDVKSIQRALEHNDRQPARIRGASTISQQTAKNVFLWQGRSWLRKGLEAYCTVLIELVWGKRRILEVYLNVAETGPGLFGVEAAAQQYFKKPAARLSRQEAAQIAACLPNPKLYKAQPPGAYVQKRTAWILRQMRNLQGQPQLRFLLQTQN
ncbi:MAG: monofunctional biosynthetic peptidoglycan transglycosylase [Lacibacter sp.]